MMRYIFVLSLFSICAFSFIGCCSVFVGTIAGVGIYSATEKRTLGTQVDDKILTMEVRGVINKTCNGRYCDLRYNAFGGEVVVAGSIDTEYARDILISKLRKTTRATKVFADISIDSIQLNEKNGMQDALLEKNITLKLMLEKNVESGRYSVMVHNRVAYILGKAVSKEELDQVILVVGNVKDIEKVVNYAYVSNRA
ncbi:Putative outer membrane lipoprotein [Candidatus Fokinia solitaria]|uniref:Outer membrane lipoprotein n=1 Tax=Candidatus Fokinia solitaria TaxID=1802984 RepID=A0A2U8BSB6_9RICK|nr:BON domain-containing protein [Candidatus Fokinia solitaria]AWD33232.1 Putative outer membrane lipoprotein [Candidatus Fokinia solitaria]